MIQHATIRGEVCFRAGDGVLMPVPDGPVALLDDDAVGVVKHFWRTSVPVPDGPVDIGLADDSVTLAWGDDKGNTGSAAITRDEYERYVKEGKIRVAP